MTSDSHRSYVLHPPMTVLQINRARNNHHSCDTPHRKLSSGHSLLSEPLTGSWRPLTFPIWISGLLSGLYLAAKQHCQKKQKKQQSISQVCWEKRNIWRMQVRRFPGSGKLASTWEDMWSVMSKRSLKMSLNFKNFHCWLKETTNPPNHLFEK